MDDVIHLTLTDLAGCLERLSGDKLRRYFTSVSKEILRVMRPGGYYLVFSASQENHHITRAMEKAGFEFLDELIWDFSKQARPPAKSAETLNPPRSPLLKSVHCPILVAQKPRDGTYLENWRRWGTGIVDSEKPLLRKRKLTTVLSVQIPDAEKDAPQGVRAKPSKLLEALIEQYSEAEQYVLDPFAGDGQILAAAQRTGRKSIGIEKTAMLCKIAMRTFQAP